MSEFNPSDSKYKKVEDLPQTGSQGEVSQLEAEFQSQMEKGMRGGVTPFFVFSHPKFLEKMQEIETAIGNKDGLDKLIESAKSAGVLSLTPRHHTDSRAPYLDGRGEVVFQNVKYYLDFNYNRERIIPILTREEYGTEAPSTWLSIDQFFAGLKEYRAIVEELSKPGEPSSDLACQMGITYEDDNKEGNTVFHQPTGARTYYGSALIKKAGEFWRATAVRPSGRGRNGSIKFEKIG